MSRPRRPIPMRLLLLLLVLAVMATACADDPAVDPAVSPSPVASPAPAGNDALAKLEEARSRWSAAGIGTYRYTITGMCPDCPTPEPGPREVVVWEGEDLDPGDRSPGVEEMYAAIESAAEAGIHTEVRYDTATGFPTEVAIGDEAGVPGAVHWRVDDFQVGLPGEPVTPDLVGLAQQRWETAGPEVYEYTMTVFCDCPLAGSTRTRVEGGRVTSFDPIYDEVTGTSMAPFALDDIFDDLAELVGSAEGVVEDGVRFRGSARFDPALGYPSWIGLDISVIDETASLAGLPGRLVLVITDLVAVESGDDGDGGHRLAEARRRWEAASAGTYTFELSYHDIGAGEFDGPFAVVVEDGVVVTVDGVPPAPGAAPPTIEALFDLIDQATQDGIDSDIIYHETLGHPVLVLLAVTDGDGGVQVSVANVVMGKPVG